MKKINKKKTKKKKSKGTDDVKQDITSKNNNEYYPDSDDEVIRGIDYTPNNDDNELKMEYEMNTDDGWQCPKCTYIQSSKNKKCELCGYELNGSNNGSNIDNSNDSDNWMAMDGNIFYDIIAHICNDIKDPMGKGFNKFMAKINDMGIKSDDAVSRAFNIAMTCSMNKFGSTGNNGANSMINRTKLIDNVMNDPNNFGLKKWMKKCGIWDKDLFIILTSNGIINIPNDLYKIVLLLYFYSKYNNNNIYY